MIDWLYIRKNHPEPRLPYSLMTRGFVLSVHRTKLGAEVMKRKLQKRFSNPKEVISALAGRNYRPFNR